MRQKTTMLSTLALVLTLAGASTARAEVLWSALGSTGSVDDASLSLFDTRRAGAFVRPDAALPAAVTLRYTIAPTAALRSASASVSAHLFDNDSGSDASVIIEVHEVALDAPQSGPSQPRLMLSSEGMAGAASLQRGESRCVDALRFDFERNAYYVVAKLVRRSASAQPGIHSIQLDSCD